MPSAAPSFFIPRTSIYYAQPGADDASLLRGNSCFSIVCYGRLFAVPSTRAPEISAIKKMLVNEKKIHIEWGDCDPLGIVYFPRYFEFFDACTNALFELAGWAKPELLRKFELAGIPLVDARARFLAPSRFGDTVLIKSSIEKWGTSSFSVAHRLHKGELLAVEGFETRVWTARANDTRGIHGKPVPREVIERFAA